MAGPLNITVIVHPALASAEASTGVDISVDDNTQKDNFLHVSLCRHPFWYLDIWLNFGLPFPSQCHCLFSTSHIGMKIKIYLWPPQHLESCVSDKKFNDSYFRRFELHTFHSCIPIFLTFNHVYLFQLLNNQRSVVK